MRKITIDICEKEYSLGLNKEEIKRGERMGWKPTKLGDGEALTQIYLTWCVGLHLFQPKLSVVECEDLYDKFREEGGDVSEVISFLMEEYSTFFQTTQLNTAKKSRVEII